MIKTECEEKDIETYNFKFICVDESGEHVRHVFGQGSFDPEETFDTLVTCSSCTADADDLLVLKDEKGNKNTKTESGPTSTNALLRQIVADVGELKAEMANASQNVERLNAAVFKESTVPPPAQAATPAPQEATPAPQEATPAPSSLVHRGASALRARGHVRASRMNAIIAHAKTSKSHIHKIRRRYTEDDVDATDQEDTQDHSGRVDDDAQDGTYVEENAQSQDDSESQDESQDQDDARRQDDVQQQEEDDADRGEEADVRNADSDDDDDEHDQVRDEDRSTDSDRDEDDTVGGERDADNDGRREESVDQ